MARLRSELAFIGSFLLTVAVVLNAFFHKKQFYPSIVYLTKSNSSMAVIYFQAFVLALLFGKLMNKIFFGQLRAIEMEHLFERSWYAITETCLAFTVFRDDFSPKFVTMFTLLLFLKCFHWLAEDRVEYMERSPVITLLFHVRILSLVTLLMVLDSYFVYLAYSHTVLKGASVQLVFGFEYAILFVNILSTAIKYLLHTIDLQNENPWENKGIFMLYGDLTLGFFRVLLYLTFMSLMIKIHTFPLFAIRPMYLSVRSFKKSLNDVIMSRRAIRNLNIMYPDVTAEQLRNYSDTICIICREEMIIPEGATGGDASGGQIKRLPCDHIFHKSCLRSWFQRQQTCPTCRTSILRYNPAQGAGGAQQPAQQQPAQQAQQHPPAQNQAHQHQAPQVPGFGQVPQQQAANGQQPTSSRAPPIAATGSSPGQLPDFANLFSQTTMPPPGNPHLLAGGVAPAQFCLPPFAFMPPPLPPLNLSGLTTEELAEMEGNERHNVEARIHCLRNISVLLNTSMIQMQQYMNICSATSHLENLTKTRREATSIAKDLKRVEEQAQTDLKQKEQDERVTTTTPISSKTGESIKNPFENLTDQRENEPLDATEESSKMAADSTNDDGMDSIRRRRLQHFNTPTTQSSSSSQ